MRRTHMVATNNPTASVRRPGALVRELSPRGGAARPEVILEARTALDFLVSLVGDTEPELLSADAAWYTAARDSLSAPLRRDMERAFGHQEAAKGIAGWALIPNARSMSRRSGAESESRAAVYQAASAERSSGSVSPTRLTRKSSAVRASRMTSGRAAPPRGDNSRTSAPGRRTEAVGLFVATM